MFAVRVRVLFSSSRSLISTFTFASSVHGRLKIGMLTNVSVTNKSCDIFEKIIDIFWRTVISNVVKCNLCLGWFFFNFEQNRLKRGAVAQAELR